MLKFLSPALVALLLTTPLAKAAVPEVAGTVVMLAGRATASGPDGTVRSLAKNDPVFEGDLLSSSVSTYVNIKFADGAFFLLRPETRFQIEEYAYIPPKPVTPAPAPAAPTPTTPAPKPATPLVTGQQGETGSATSRAFFRLVKGGFRSVSGLIGKVNRDDYRVSTPIATIGIRGTAYSARLCEGACEDRGQLVDLLRDSGKAVPANDTLLVTTVDEGSIELQTAQGETAQDACTSGVCGAVCTSSDGVTTVTATRPTVEQNEQDLKPALCI